MSNIIDSIQLSGSSYDVRDKSATTVVEITQSDYDNLPSSAKTSNILYIITDGSVDYITSGQCQTQINNSISGKQDTLVSGTNIKTINNESLLGSGNIDIQGGGGKAVTGGTNISVTTGETADTINCTLPITASTSIRKKDITIGNDIVNGTSDYRRLTIGNGNKYQYSNSRTSDSILIATPSNTSSIYNIVKASSCIGIGGNGLEVGYDNANGYGSIAIGYGAKSNINKSLAIGYNTVASGTTQTNINNQLTIDTSNQVYIYNKDNTEMICLQDQLGGSSITIDPSLDSGSTNAVANSAITTAIDSKANKTAAYGSTTWGESNNKEYVQFTKVSGIRDTARYISKINGKTVWGTTNINACKNWELVETSAITTSVTSSSTDSEIPSAKAVNDKLGGLSLVKLTQSEYDALATKDSNTLYVIVN